MWGRRAAEGGSDLNATLAAAKPYLKVVTLTGAEPTPSTLPLGSGGYDVAPSFDAIAALPFAGHAGRQGCSIDGVGRTPSTSRPQTRASET